jgi:hypothetical protein
VYKQVLVVLQRAEESERDAEEARKMSRVPSSGAHLLCNLGQITSPLRPQLPHWENGDRAGLILFHTGFLRKHVFD